ncbi:MAG: histidine phosphatase family protein [Acidovorax sp.]|nr:histidine phosphatase family protein [Acidovorax sp.]
MGTLYLVRHGQTQWNLEKRLQGATDNVLNETGRRQAAELAQRLAGVSFSHIYSSGLRRAQETAAAFAGATPVTALPALNERSFGKFEGIYEDQRDAALFAEFGKRGTVLDDSLDGGESLRVLRERVVDTTHRLAARHPGELVLLVTHGGVLDVLYRAATRQDIQAPRTWQLGNAAINRLLWTHGHGLSLVGWADTQHLEHATRDETTA